MRNDKKIIISAHRNTLRADGIANLNISTGTPLIYELDDNLNPIRHYYLSIKGEIPKDEIPKFIQ